MFLSHKYTYVQVSFAYTIYQCCSAASLLHVLFAFNLSVHGFKLKFSCYIYGLTKLLTF